MTQKEFATLGGHARAKKLSRRRRIEIARNAGLAAGKQRHAGKKESCQSARNGETKSK